MAPGATPTAGAADAVGLGSAGIEGSADGEGEAGNVGDGLRSTPTGAGGRVVGTGCRATQAPISTNHVSTTVASSTRLITSIDAPRRGFVHPGIAKPSTVTSGRPAVPEVTIRIWCVPAVDQCRLNTTGRGSIEVLFSSIVEIRTPSMEFGHAHLGDVQVTARTSIRLEQCSQLALDGYFSAESVACGALALTFTTGGRR